MTTMPETTIDTETLSAPPAEFRVEAPAEVHALLRQMLDEQTRITLGGPDGAAVGARLSTLDPARGIIALELPLPQDPQLAALLGADEITATGYLDQIRVAFDLDGLVQVSSAGGTLLRAALPTVLLRFQRRQSFRVRPNTRTPQVRLQLAGPTEAEERLRIADVSVGGLALLLPAGPAPELGSEFEARIELDRENHFNALLRLQHIGALPPEPGNTAPPGLKLGFAWADISPAALRAVQLFIDQTQRLNRLLRSKA